MKKKKRNANGQMSKRKQRKSKNDVEENNKEQKLQGMK